VARFDVAVYGATPGGIAAAIATARMGQNVVLREPPSAPSDFARRNEDFLAELRGAVFQSRTGDCLSENRLTELYSAGLPIPCESVAYLVSCPACLDAVNRLLGLPHPFRGG
jgi:2-polyprenyl-6-methoxyphenol hydroxylase-like FAD-dependent oxidoreductase